MFEKAEIILLAYIIILSYFYEIVQLVCVNYTI